VNAKAEFKNQRGEEERERMTVGDDLFSSKKGRGITLAKRPNEKTLRSNSKKFSLFEGDGRDTDRREYENKQTLKIP